MSRFGVFPNLPKQKNGVFGLRFFVSIDPYSVIPFEEQMAC